MRPTGPHSLGNPKSCSVKETFGRAGRAQELRTTTTWPAGRSTDGPNEDTWEPWRIANGARGTLEADRSIFGPQSSMAFEINGSRGAASWDHEKLNQLRLYLAEEQPNDGFIEVLAGDAFPRQGDIVPGGGNSLGYEDLKLIEALEFLTAVVEGRPFHPGFDDAWRWMVLEAMIRSWTAGGWEEVRPLNADAEEGRCGRTRPKQLADGGTVVVLSRSGASLADSSLCRLGLWSSTPSTDLRGRKRETVGPQIPQCPRSPGSPPQKHIS